MKNFKHASIFTGLTLAISLLLITCSKDVDTKTTEQEVSFAIKSPATPGNSYLKSASARKLNDVKKIILTIKTKDGMPTSFTMSEVKIFQMNGEFFSQRITLQTGEYQLTQFMLVDSAGNTIYATPLEGSQESQFVSYPLPIVFEVIKDTSTPVYLDVINTENKRPSDFGFAGFPIFERKGIYFNMSVLDRESGDLLSSKLTLYDFSGFRLYNEYRLNNTTNNLVIIDTAYSTCVIPYLVVSKEGYIPYKQVISRDSLKKHNITPLLVELEKVKYETDAIKDIDANEYKTVKIGNQWWMAENLITTRFADGTEIPYIDKYDTFGWEELPANAVAHTGRGFYTWGAAMHLKETTAKNNKIQGVCPAGWHLPSETEWKQLVSYLTANGYGYEGDNTALGKSLASESTSWSQSYTPGEVGCLAAINNGTGFSGLPLGQRSNLGDWEESYYASNWWSSTSDTSPDSHKAWSRKLYFNDKTLKSELVERNNGYNVRCIKD
jgi:uncharacterized protein (TIGR02145 family)